LLYGSEFAWYSSEKNRRFGFLKGAIFNESISRSFRRTIKHCKSVPGYQKKNSCLDQLSKNGIALNNIDDKNGLVDVTEYKARKYTSRFKKIMQDYRAQVLEISSMVQLLKNK